MKTLHLGPDELLVAAKIAVPGDESAADVARSIDAAETADPRGGADRQGDLPRTRHRSGREQRGRPRRSLATRAEHGPARQPDQGLRLGLPHGDRRRAGPPGADRRAGGGAVDGRPPGRSVPAGPRRPGVHPDRGGRGGPGGRARAGDRWPSTDRSCRSCSSCSPPSGRCSIQAHPDAAQARAGFAAENAAGIPLDDPKRNYVDPNHKPELLYAVTRFRGALRFPGSGRDPGRARRLDAPLLARHLAELRARPDADGLRATLTSAARARRGRPGRAGRAGPGGEPAALRRAVRRWSRRLAAQYPGDLGVLVALLLNQFRIPAGEAVFVSAGMPHAYLRGTGIELLASSDNVVRGGLTPKHVDSGELLRLLRFEPGPVRPLSYREPAAGAAGLGAAGPRVRTDQGDRLRRPGRTRRRPALESCSA